MSLFQRIPRRPFLGNYGTIKQRKVDNSSSSFEVNLPDNVWIFVEVVLLMGRKLWPFLKAVSRSSLVSLDVGFLAVLKELRLCC